MRCYMSRCSLCLCLVTCVFASGVLITRTGPDKTRPKGRFFKNAIKYNEHTAHPVATQPITLERVATVSDGLFVRET